MTRLEIYKMLKPSTPQVMEDSFEQDQIEYDLSDMKPETIYKIAFEAGLITTLSRVVNLINNEGKLNDKP